MTGIHTVEKKRSGKPSLFYVYAWRGGPQIHKAQGVRPVIGMDLIAKANQARQTRSETPASTLRHYIEQYRAHPQFTSKRPSTQRDYRYWLDRIDDKFGHAPVDAFNDVRMRADIDNWRNTWAGQPRNADKALVMLSILLNWIKNNKGRLAVNVASGIPLLYSSDKSELIWEEGHWTAVENEKDFPPHLMRALRLAGLTGLRLGDLVRLQWSQVFDKNITVEKTRKRGGRAVIPVLSELRELLDNIGRKDGPVLLNSRGGQWTESGLETVWQRRKPKGFDRTIHDLRGTYVTFLAVKGLTDEQIARIVGWTAKRVGEVRARYVDEAKVVVSLVERLSA